MRQTWAVVAVLLAAVLFGTTGTVQALGPDGTTPLGVGAVRLAVGGLGLLVVLPLLGGRVAGAVRLWRTAPGLVAGLCTAGYQVAFFAAVDATGVAVGTLVAIGSGPVLAGALARVVLGERPSRPWLVVTGVCLAGLALLVGGGGGGRIDPAGIALALLAALSYAGYTVLAKQRIDQGRHPAEVMASAFGLGGLVLLPVLLTQPLGWLARPSGLALALYLGLVATTAGYLLFARGLARLPAGPVATLMLAEPVVATVLGVGVLGERLTLVSAVGVGLLLVGLLLQGVGVGASPQRLPDAEPGTLPVPAG